ncbi:prephenate dehydrogenase [Agrilactobacillus composti DSM 18527 = JCM 14202]|nr:prephenate dehydrogenase [Agrilactobacillus composti DSM 18527 = JCM 14202]
MNIPDKTGSIAAITTKLAQAEINIINIQILETRDDINGVLQLTFSNQHDLQQATELLGQKAVAS